MGVLDDFDGHPIVREARNGLNLAATQAEVELTPIAREVIELFVISPAFETPAVLEGEVDSQGASLSVILSSQLSRFLIQAKDDYQVDRRSRLRGIVTALDVYHWLAERARNEIQLGWPYPKED
jgi:hypothetical protein